MNDLTGADYADLLGPEWYADPELVECPACAGQGHIYPGATVGMWAGLVAFDAKPETCELCDGQGEITPDLAAEWESRQAEAFGTE